MNELNIGVAGCSGRMGRSLLQCISTSKSVNLGVAFEAEGNAFLDRDLGEIDNSFSGKKIMMASEETLKHCDVLIDFTRPLGTMEHLRYCETSGTGLVIGTTGLMEKDHSKIKEASKVIPVVIAPNMSIGVNLVFKLLETAATALGEDFDIEIVEAHHRQKVDAPSGTAIGMASAIANAKKVNLKEVAVHERKGLTGERKDGQIGFSVIRGGDIVGDHTVLFAGDGERVEISHKAGSRANFARGALRAAQFVSQKKSGLYNMRDVLGLN